MSSNLATAEVSGVATASRTPCGYSPPAEACSSSAAQRARRTRRLSQAAARMAVQGKLSTALTTIERLEARLDALKQAMGNPRVSTRLAAIAPYVDAQLRAADAGQVDHTSRGLVHPDVHVLGSAAKHNFTDDFEHLTAAQARKAQRGLRHRQQSDSDRTSPALARRARCGGKCGHQQADKADRGDRQLADLDRAAPTLARRTRGGGKSGLQQADEYRPTSTDSWTGVWGVLAAPLVSGAEHWGVRDRTPTAQPQTERGSGTDDNKENGANHITANTRHWQSGGSRAEGKTERPNTRDFNQIATSFLYARSMLCMAAASHTSYTAIGTLWKLWRTPNSGEADSGQNSWKKARNGEAPKSTDRGSTAVPPLCNKRHIFDCTRRCNLPTAPAASSDAPTDLHLMLDHYQASRLANLVKIATTFANLTTKALVTRARALDFELATRSGILKPDARSEEQMRKDYDTLLGAHDRADRKAEVPNKPEDAATTAPPSTSATRSPRHRPIAQASGLATHQGIILGRSLAVQARTALEVR